MSRLPTDEDYADGEISEAFPEVCGCGAKPCWAAIPSIGVQNGGTFEGWLFWCELKNCNACGSTHAEEYRKPWPPAEKES